MYEYYNTNMGSMTVGRIILTGQGQVSNNSKGRFRFSSAHSLLDVDLTKEKNSHFMGELLTSGGSCNHDGNQLNLKSNGITGESVYQSKEYLSPHTGSSNSCFICANLNETNSIDTSGSTRIGLFDSHNDKVNDSTGCGIFLEQVGGQLFMVKRTYTSIIDQVDERIGQANWNISTLDGIVSSLNPTGYEVNSNDIVILTLEVDGMKGIRVGFVLQNETVYAHYFSNGILPTRKLPIRAEISGTNSTSSLVLYSAGVQSENLCQYRGITRVINTDSATITVDGLDKCFCNIRLGVGYERRTIRINSICMVVLGENILFWSLLLNATPNSPSWVATGGIEVDRSSTTLTGGFVVKSGFVRNSETVLIHTDLNVLSLPALTSSISGIPDTYSLKFSTVGNISVDVSSSIELIEIS